MVNGTMTDLDPANLGYDSSAVAINNAGQIVITTDAVWRRVVTGYKQWQYVASQGSSYYTLVLTNGVSTNVGNLGSTDGTYGSSINSFSDVVGYTVNAFGSGHIHGFLYHAGTIVDLNDHVTNLGGFRISAGRNINDLGQIVCLVVDANGNYQTALLTPILS